MDNNKIKILFADTDGEELVKYFQGKDKYEVVGNVNNGQDLVKLAVSTNPNFIVMDVMLAGMDGFMVLNNLKKNMPTLPKIVFISNISHSGFVTKAIKEGVDYFMVKPIMPENLEERLEDLKDNKLEEDAKNEKQLEEKISNIFISIGIPAHIKGYQFLREAVKLAVEEPEIIGSITKRLYPTIAEKFETSSSKVERGMRHAIEVAWNRGKIENINALFGLKIYSSNEKPTNGELIALIADKMLMEG